MESLKLAQSSPRLRTVQLGTAVGLAMLLFVALLCALQAVTPAHARQSMRVNGIDPDEANMAIASGRSVATDRSNYMTVTAPIVIDFYGRPESWKAGVVNLNVFGRDGNTIYGDAFSPLYSSEKPGQACSCASPCSNADWRLLLQGRDSKPGVYPFRIHVPADYVTTTGTSLIQVEILDPDSCNDPANSVLVTHLDGTTERKSADGTSQSWRAMADTGDAQNPKWFVRMDQNVGFCGDTGYKDSEAVTTEYTLYYYKQNDRTPHEIAQYRVRRDCNTDLEWVIPGVTPGVGADFGSFSFDLMDYPDIAADENANKSFYLDVEGIDGPGGNGYDLWAGPPPTVTVPTNVNDRNVFLINELNEGRNPHPSGGVSIWAAGFLPLSVNTNTTYTVTLGYLRPEAIRVRVSNFDLDRDTRSPPTGIGNPTSCPSCEPHQCFGRYLHYLLEGVPDFYVEGFVSCGSRFGEDVFQIPEEFDGGYLYAVFETSRNDTTDWMVEYLGRIYCYALTEVSITGPTVGIAGTAYTFTATVSPPTTTLPINYTWQATEQTPVTHNVYSLSDTVAFTWTVAGSQIVTVTAINCFGSDVATTTVTTESGSPEPDSYIYLPLIMRAYPL
jgi:hypothetical protein